MTYEDVTLLPVLRLWRKAKAMGFGGKLVSVRAIDIPVLNEDEGMVEEALLREGKKSVEEGVDAVVLGCGTYFGMEKRLQERLKVPVIDCALAGLKIAELLVRLKLFHSKHSFPFPPDKRRVID
jgi:allantoin racemase